MLLTHVVTVASQISLTTGGSSPEVVRARDLLQGVLARARSSGIMARGLVEVARSVEDGLLAASQSHHAGTILVGYSDLGSEAGETSHAEEWFDRTMHRVARKAHADVIVAKFRRESHERIAMPVSIGAQLGLPRSLLAALGGQPATEVTFVHVVGSGASVDDAQATVSAELEAGGLAGMGQLEVQASDTMVESVVAAGADHDLVILTPADRPRVLSRFYSSRAEKIAERVSGSVILAWGSEASE